MMMNNLSIYTQSPSKSLREHNVSHSYLAEVKRFITYYQTCLYYQKHAPIESIQTKDSLNTIYHQLLLLENEDDISSHLVSLIKVIMDIVNNNQVLSSIWKASIKTLIKLLQYPEIASSLKGFDPTSLVQVFLDSKFDMVDQSEEEQKLLLIQKALIKVIKAFHSVLTEDIQIQVCKYILRVLKNKTVEDNESYYSLQFSDSTKKNLHQAFYHIMNTSELTGKERVFEYLYCKIQKVIQLFSDKKNQNNLKLKEYACFLIKTIEDCIKKITSKSCLKSIILASKSHLIEVVCLCAEQEDIMIRNQGQQLCTPIIKLIIDLNLPLREHLEVLLVKVVLKPALLLAKKLMSKNEKIQASPQSTNEQSKDSTSTSAALHDSDYEHDEEFIQISTQQIYNDRNQQEELLLEMNINFLAETLLQLKPDQLFSLFLLYDCQPFSETIITKSIILVLKYAQRKKSSYLTVFTNFLHSFKSFDPSKYPQPQIQGPSQLQYMLEQKQQYRKLVKELNVKYKNFLAKLDQMYAYADEGTAQEVAAKLMVFSRDVQIDKIAEVIGGKDERAKRLLSAYLSKMDYSQHDIEQSLRRFLQTYRLAGVDSQVILRILELFSHKFFEMDTTRTFQTKEEAYEFCYLIIVLQTCQHNPSVKNKTDIKSFIESAEGICPKSKAHFREGFFEHIYNSVSKYPFYTPTSRSLIDESFNPYTLNEIEIRLSKITNENTKECISESEFINTADLSSKQLFEYSNSFNVPPSLIPMAGRHLLSFLTQRYTKQVLQDVKEAPKQDISTENANFSSKQKQSTIKKFNILKDMINVNKKMGNQELVDKLFQVCYKVIVTSSSSQQDDQVMQKELESMLWDNFDCLKKSLILLPRLLMKSLMKDNTRNMFEKVFNSVERIIHLKHQEKGKMLENSDQQSAAQKSQGKGPIQNRSQSFFDLVYNYFTENAEEEETERKELAEELQLIDAIRRKMFTDEKEGDYSQNIDERDDSERYKIHQQSRIGELMTLVCSQIRENLNQEDGVLCLAYLQHLINQVTTQELIEKLWIELHLLASQVLKTKSQQEVVQTLSQQNSKEESKQDYEIVSNDTSQDSINQSCILNSGVQEVFLKETNPQKQRIYEALSRHIIFAMHINCSSQIINNKVDNQHVIRDIQRMVSQTIEDPTGGGVSDQNAKHFNLLDDLFVFSHLNEFQAKIAPNHSLKSYPKISKLLRLKLILILRSLTRRLESDSSSTDLLSQQMTFLKEISSYLNELSPQLPFDLITLAQDVLSKLHIIHTKTTSNENLEQIYYSCTQILENLKQALNKQSQDVPEDTKFDAFNHLLLIQDKVITTHDIKIKSLN